MAQTFVHLGYQTVAIVAAFRTQQRLVQRCRVQKGGEGWVNMWVPANKSADDETWKERGAERDGSRVQNPWGQGAK